MVSVKEKKNRNKLFTLMFNNPDLPVIPFVAEDAVAGNEFGYWMGRWGDSRIDEYIFPEDNLEPAIFKSNIHNLSNVINILENCFPNKVSDQLPKSEDEYKKIFDSLPWSKAIIVEIDMPEV